MVIPIKDINPTKRFPYVTIILVALNFSVFLYELSLGNGLEPFISRYGLIPKFTAGTEGLFYFLSTFPTSIFIHGGWLHVISNMLYLWIFGNNIEDYLGRFRFILFYFSCGLIATWTHVFFNPVSSLPTIGASGAIAGILGAYLILFPRARVVSLVPVFFFIEIVSLPAVVVIGFWFLIQLASGYTAFTHASYADVGGVAWFAHIGGFLAGFVLLFFFRIRRKPYS